jgi:hypothetical protein
MKLLITILIIFAILFLAIAIITALGMIIIILCGDDDPDNLIDGI